LPALSKACEPFFVDASENSNHANGLNRSEKKQNSINKPQQDSENNELIIAC
jgi:hypothetical protein